MFLPNGVQTPHLQQITTPTGRVYLDPVSGVHYPSVTTILSYTKDARAKRALEEWKDRTEDHEEITAKAGKRGTALHEMAESYIFGRLDLSQYRANERDLFYSIYKHFDRIDNISVVEAMLCSNRLKTAGATDLVAEFDGKRSIIDYKTARYERRPEDIGDYYVQETMYAMMYWELTREPIHQIVTIMAVDNIGESFVFVENPKKYVDEAFRRIKQYHLTYTFDTDTMSIIKRG